MSTVQIYTGGCHCGAVRYEVQTDLAPVISCNCSMCSKAGWLLTFVPAGQFTLLSGEDNLTDYQFNKKIVHHLFCKTCGVKSFGRGKDKESSDTVAINVRCLDDVEPSSLTPFVYDGKNA
jgi:hypothetical protein